MGGLAFVSDGLSTPRMTPEVYHSVLLHVEEILKAHFRFVGHPLEAPAKTSHGDIDVLVAEPIKGQAPTVRSMGEYLAKLLGAKAWKGMGGSSYNVAVPWPEVFEEEVVESCLEVAPEDCDTVAKTKNENQISRIEQPSTMEQPVGVHPALQLRKKSSVRPAFTSTQRYIQIDVNVMQTAASFDWFMFFEAHGDLWNMIGGIIRRFGLTATSKGLFVRIEQVERHNKEQARVLLTTDPNTVLDYLGLDKDRYWKAFGSWEEMLQYVASCRFHNPCHWQIRSPSEGDPDLNEPQATSITKMLKANDRQRAAKRPLFGYWIEEYLPAHVDDPPGRSAFLTREQIVEDAKQFFGPDFAQRFEDRKTKVARQIGVDKLWADFRKLLPLEGTEMGYVMKRMKREIAEKRGGEPSSGELEGLEEAQRAFDESNFDDVLEWASVNWKAVVARQNKLDEEQSRRHLLEKISRDEKEVKG